MRYCLLSLILAVGLVACSDAPDYEEGADTRGHTAPTSATAQANQAFLEKRPFADRQDFEDARRGLIAQEASLKVAGTNGETIWDMDAYGFIDNEGAHAPSSVNPSLWRQAALNNIHGLFQVTEGVYQLRGYDLANMTLIKGDTGWILVDPLTARETASRAFRFARKHLGEKPVVAILFTHSHIDHFGGVEGILENLSPNERANLRIIAPEGFTEEATSENIIAGPAMGRRSMYMYGKALARSERGHVGTGLGKGPAFGAFTFAEPTELIDAGVSELTIDGVPFVFQSVSGSEAPAEFTFYLPRHKAFCGAELVSRNMHNLYTLRGAKVRDARVWSSYIEQARNLFGDAEVYFGSHHWPIWGRESIQAFLVQQRDTYRYIHDQTVRLMNQGHTPNEIAERLELPESLRTAFHNQGYYGTVKHNARAVYQAYLGWFTANPATLDPLPETEAAQRYMEMMGGTQAVLEKARRQLDEAAAQEAEAAAKTYRWLAELLNHAVFADPHNAEARAMLAKVYDQLGYQAESAPWRDVYLTGAHELRHGAPEQGVNPAVMKQVLLRTPVQKFFDSFAVSLDGERAAGKDLQVKITLTDLNESYLLSLENAVLHHKPVTADAPADATLRLTRPLLVDIIVGDAGLRETLFGDDLEVEGNPLDLIGFFSLFDKPQGNFHIVTP